MDWSWPRIGCILVAGVFGGAGIGLIIDGDWGVGLMCLIVAGLAGLGASLINDS